MGEPTDDNGWGLPSAGFWRSLCPPPLPPPWPPQRPDLIPPWQDPAERQRAAQAAVEAERVRAEQEETLQFIRDYVQALRDWRKEIIFRMGDHIIGRTTITLFKNQSAGDQGQSSSAQPVAGDAGTLTAELARSNPIKLDIPSASAPSAGAIERPEQTAATVESPGTSPNGGPGIVEDDPALAGTNSRAGDIAIEPAEPVIVSSEGPALLTRFGPGNQTMTDTAPDDGSPEQIVVTAPRPAAPEERPVTAPSGPSAGSGFPFSFISSAQAQEVPETEVDPAVEEEAAKNEAVLQAREIALEREALAQRADLATVKGNAEIKAAAANVSNPLEPFLTPRNPALDALAVRVRRAQTNPAPAPVQLPTIDYSEAAGAPNRVPVPGDADFVGPLPGPTGPVQELEVGSYQDLRSRAVVGDGLEHDHIPSFAALRTAAEAENGCPLTTQELNDLYDNATAVEVPRDVHIDGPTFGGKNTAGQIAADAADLPAAIARDTNVLRDNLIERGYDPAVVEQTIQKIIQRNTDQGLIQ